MKPEALLLDAGGTLCWPPFDRLDAILAELKGQSIGIEAHYRAFYRGSHALDDYLKRHRAYPVQDSFSLNHWVYEEGIAREGYPGLWSRECTEEIYRRDRRLGKWDYTFDWVRTALQRLKQSGLRLGLVSNSDGHVAELMQQLGYAEYFETIVDSYIEQVAKPDPRIFAIALRRMGLERLIGAGPTASPVMYCGDNWRSDFEGATAAGLQIRLIDPLGLFADWTELRVRDVTALADELCG
jgi:HAD superfamily hydrolase (TIGR01549 family)